MQDNTIINQLIQDPLTLYSSKEFKESSDFRKKVSRAEELLLDAIFTLKQNSIDAQTCDLDENEIALLVDQLEDKQIDDKLVTAELTHHFIDQKRMQKNSGEWHNVPEGLRAYIGRSLDFEESLHDSSKSIPGFAINLFADGLKVIKSSIQGFDLVPVTMATTRKSNVEKTLPSIVSLTHKNEIGEVEINLVNEDENRMGLSLSFKQEITGRVILKSVENDGSQNKMRILDSYSLDEQTNINFPGIGKGAYIIHIQPSDQKLAFVVH